MPFVLRMPEMFQKGKHEERCLQVWPATNLEIFQEARLDTFQTAADHVGGKKYGRAKGN